MSAPYHRSFVACTALLLAAASTAFLLLQLLSASNFHKEAVQTACKAPSLRREWRSLQQTEQVAYIDAVLCLTRTESTLKEAGTLFDDFALVHMQVGAHSHFSAPFFPWHRMFLHVFEYNLRNTCQFEGSLPYWDWTLDWRNLTASPVWDDSFGFGGDGNTSSERPFGDGSYCVTTGPFGGLEVRYRNGTVSPHCLSRGFTHFETGKKGAISGEHLRPFEIERLMEQPHYNGFRNMTEYLFHNALHWGVHGDFGQWSSANDPIFYLHHTQLDRLWWIWQRQRPERLSEYFGSTYSRASLVDKMSFLDLWQDIEVGEVVRADGDFLCYTY